MSFPLPDKMPSLDLTIPPNRQGFGSVELNEELLHHWIRRLPSNDPVEFTSRYLDALQRLNHNEVPHVQRIKLLDIYRGPFNKVLFGMTIPKLQQLVRAPDARQQLITDMGAVFAELATGYKIMVMEADEQGDNLKLKPLVHMAIYRAIVQLSYLALHNYKFYRTLPIHLIRELHQLYLLMDASGLADKPVFVNNQFKEKFSVKHRYTQIMLTSICNPYGLGSGDVLRCYHLMLQLAPAARTVLLPEKSEPQPGHFYINCLSHRNPVPSMLPVLDNNYRPPTIMLDTKPILTRVDDLFVQADSQGKHHPAADNIQLLRQIVPFLNTSYKRKQARVPVEGSSETYISVGLPHIHATVSQPQSLPITGDPWLERPWEILNKNSYGYLVQKRKLPLGHDLKIGDFVGILDPVANAGKPRFRLALIRWLRTDEFDQSKLGLKFIHGDAMAVSFSIADEQTRQPAFLIREDIRHHQPAMLITASGIFDQGRQLTIKTGKKRFNFTVSPDRLLEQNQSFESFTFKDVLD